MPINAYVSAHVGDVLCRLAAARLSSGRPAAFCVSFKGSCTARAGSTQAHLAVYASVPVAPQQVHRRVLLVSILGGCQATHSLTLHFYSVQKTHSTCIDLSVVLCDQALCLLPTRHMPVGLQSPSQHARLPQVVVSTLKL